ncbi:MAG: peptidoglycan-binding protein, partial [Thermodesulfobacteriota bacterium]
MIGQPELRDLLKRQELRQLEQRVTARYHLDPLNYTETVAYINHRLQVAGMERPLFTRRALRSIYRLSGGVPRLINLLCDRALLGAYATNHNHVTPELVRTTAREIFGSDVHQGLITKLVPRALTLGAGIIFIAAGIVAFTAFLPPQTGSDAPLKADKATEQSAQSAPTSDDPGTDSRQESASTFIWDRDLWDNATRDAAARQLFTLWGISSASAEKTLGAKATEHGLNVLERRGSLATLRKLNRPAILVLEDDEGRRRYATLTGLDSTHAVLSFAEHILRIKATELARHWRGDFILLWQAPAGYTTPVYPEHKGEIVSWLDGKLAFINERPAAVYEGSLSLSGALLDELRQFQASKGLTPDGILGPVTLIHLRNATTASGPRLHSVDADEAPRNAEQSSTRRSQDIPSHVVYS